MICSQFQHCHRWMRIDIDIVIELAWFKATGPARPCLSATAHSVQAASVCRTMVASATASHRFPDDGGHADAGRSGVLGQTFGGSLLIASNPGERLPDVGIHAGRVSKRGIQN